MAECARLATLSPFLKGAEKQSFAKIPKISVKNFYHGKPSCRAQCFPSFPHCSVLAKGFDLLCSHDDLLNLSFQHETILTDARAAYTPCAPRNSCAFEVWLRRLRELMALLNLPRVAIRSGRTWRKLRHASARMTNGKGHSVHEGGKTQLRYQDQYLWMWNPRKGPNYSYSSVRSGTDP